MLLEVSRDLVGAGLHEQAGVLGFNLAESMDAGGRVGNADIQREFLRHSVEVFPENFLAIRSLGYRLEQAGEETRAMELYRDSLENESGRLDLRLLIASTCSPFMEHANQEDERCMPYSYELSTRRCI